jgi:hypothetical protein
MAPYEEINSWRRKSNPELGQCSSRPVMSYTAETASLELRRFVEKA